MRRKHGDSGRLGRANRRQSAPNKSRFCSFTKRLAGDSRRDQGLRSLRRSAFTLPAGTRTMSSAAVSAMATPRVPEVQSAYSGW